MISEHADFSGPSVLNDVHRVRTKQTSEIAETPDSDDEEDLLQKKLMDLSIGLRLLEKKGTRRDTHMETGTPANGQVPVIIGSPKGNRTPASGVRGQRPDR